MFKNLIGKIGESTLTALAEAGISPNRNITNTNTDPRASSLSNDLFSIGDSEDNDSEPSRRRPIPSPFQSEFSSVDLSVPDAVSPKLSRSRRSSTSSILSDASSVRPLYALASDLESASELDDSFGHQPASNEQLLAALRKNQQRYHKYKGRYSDLIRHYRDLERENAKTKKVLADFQDRCLRREGELKEQCALEQRAKAHLEEILRNDLEEKDHLITTLNTKILLLKSQAETDTKETTSVKNCDGELIDLASTYNQNDPELEEELIYTNTPESLEYEALGQKIESLKQKMRAMGLHLLEETVCMEAEETEAHQCTEAMNQSPGAKSEMSTMRLVVPETKQSHEIDLEGNEKAVHNVPEKINLLNSSQKILSLVGDDSQSEDKEVNALGSKEPKYHHIIKTLEERLQDEQNKTSKIQQDFDNLQVETCALKRKLEEATVNNAASETSMSLNLGHESDIDGLASKRHETHVQSNDQNIVLDMDNAIASVKTTLAPVDYQDLEAVWQSWKMDYYREKAVSNKKLTSIKPEVRKLSEALKAAAMNGADVESVNNVRHVLKNLCQLLDAKPDMIHIVDAFLSYSEADIKDIQQQTEDLRAEQVKSLEQAQHNNQQLDRQIEELKESQVSLIDEREDLTKHNSELLEELRQLNHNCDLAKKEVAKIAENELLLNTELEKHKKELEQLNVNNNLLQEEIKVATETKAARTCNLEHSIKSLDTLQEQLQQLNVSNDSLQEEIKVATETKAARTCDLEHSIKSLDTLQEQLQQLNVSNDSLQEEIKVATETKAARTCDLEHSIKSLDTLQKQLQQLNVSNDSLQEEIKVATETKAARTCDLEHSIKSLDTLQEQLQQLNVSNDSLQEEIKVATETKAARTCDLEHSIKSLDTLQEQLQQLNVSNDSLQEEIKVATETKAARTCDLEHSIKSLDTLQEQLQQLNVSNDSLQEEIKVATETKAARTCDLEHSIKSLDTLQEQLQQLHINNDKIKNEIEITCETKVFLTRELQERLKFVAQLQEQLKQLNARNDLLIKEIEGSKDTQTTLGNKLTEGQKRIQNLKDELQPLGKESLRLRDEIEQTLHTRLVLTTELDEGFDHVNSIIEEIVKMKRRKDEQDEVQSLLAAKLEEGLGSIEQLNDMIEQSAKDKELLEGKLKEDENEIARTLAGAKTKLTAGQNRNQMLVDEYQLLSLKKESLEEDVSSMRKTVESLTNDLDLMKREKQNMEELKMSKDDCQLKDDNISQLQELHRIKIKQLSNEFEDKLYQRIQEITESHEREIGLLREEEGNEVIQMRNQLKLYKLAAEQSEKHLKESQNLQEQEMKTKDLEISSLKEDCASLSAKYEADLREAIKKWRQHSDHEIDELKSSHKEELSALSEEWHNERKSPNSHDTTPSESEQELENTNRVAVAAFESSTGTLEMLQRELVSQKQEIEKLKTKHKSEMTATQQSTSRDDRETKDYTKEYLRNVLFEFMMGNASHDVLVKVLADLVHFDPEQTKKVMEKFNQKPSLLGNLRLL